MNNGKIYKYRNPGSIIISVILSVLIFLIIVAVIIFFAFQKYIVYTEDGVRLEVPWLQEAEEVSEDGGENTLAQEEAAQS